MTSVQSQLGVDGAEPESERGGGALGSGEGLRQERLRQPGGRDEHGLFEGGAFRGVGLVEDCGDLKIAVG